MVKYYVIRAAVIALVVIVIFIIGQLAFIRLNGMPVQAPEIPRKQLYGTGRPLTYVVMGDSTAISQGSAYEAGYAVASAKHLSGTNAVTLVNTGVSGATAQAVVERQLPEAVKVRPDVVLLAVGANDATHFTRGSAIRGAVQTIVDELKKANPMIKIVVTGSPAMDSVDRFPLGAKQLMRLRTNQVNTVFRELTAKNGLIFAPIAANTREAFLADPTLFAADKFHPNGRGYALWTPIIIEALDTALQ